MPVELHETIKELWPTHTPKEVAAIIGPQYYKAIVNYAFNNGLRHDDATLERIRQIHRDCAAKGSTPEANKKKAEAVRRAFRQRKLEKQQFLENLKNKFKIK